MLWIPDMQPTRHARDGMHVHLHDMLHIYDMHEMVDMYTSVHHYVDTHYVHDVLPATLRTCLHYVLSFLTHYVMDVESSKQ